MATTLLSLDQKLLEEVGDWLQYTVTTAIAASTSIVSTSLPIERATADYFNNWWIYIDDFLNIDVERLISDDDGSNTLTVQGANLTSDSANKATFRLSKYSRFTERLRAINMALEEAYPYIYQALDNRQLMTGNILPPFRWSSSSALDIWSTSNATLAQTTTAGLIRGEGADSALLTASAGNGYLSCHSDNYRRLLDLMAHTIDVEVWVYPSTANDVDIVVYTQQADGTAQTLTSTTTCPATQWTKLQLLNQGLNDNLIDVDIRVKITTNGETCYVSRPIVTGHDVYEYLLPKDFDNGEITEIYIQTSGEAGEPVDDLHPRFTEKLWGWSIIDDNTYKYLRLPFIYPTPYQLRILGHKPITAVTAGTSTIPIESHHLRPLVHYAASKLFEFKATRVSGEDSSRYREMSFYHYNAYERLVRAHSMVQKSPQLNIRM